MPRATLVRDGRRNDGPHTRGRRRRGDPQPAGTRAGQGRARRALRRMRRGGAGAEARPLRSGAAGRDDAGDGRVRAVPRHPRLGGRAHRVPHGEKLRGRCRVRSGPGGGRLPAQALRRGRAAREGGGAPAAGAARAQARAVVRRAASRPRIARGVRGRGRRAADEDRVRRVRVPGAPSRPGVLARPDRGERVGMGRGKRRVDDIGACGERARETEGGGRRAHRHGVGSGYKWTA